STSATLNNVTGTKQTVNATTGLLLLASSDTTNRNWWSDAPLSTPTTTTTTSTSTTTTSTSTPTSTSTTSTTAPAPTTVTVTPVADTYVRSDTPTTNYGTATRVDADGSPIQISYLKYDLSAYGGRQITSAKLTVRVTDDGSTGTQAVKIVT